jgi:hypothetical protein
MCASRSAWIISGAAPVRGSRYGGGSEALDVSVRVNQVGGAVSGKSQTKS